MRAPIRYRILLLLLPAWFRRRHGPAMEETFVEAWSEARRRGLIARWALWLREIADLARVRVRLREGGRGSARGARDAGTSRLHSRERGRSVTAAWTKAADDFVSAARSLRRNRGFALFAALTIALGIGASTAMFSALDGVWLHPLPYPHADRLVDLMRSGFGGSVLIPPDQDQVRAWSQLHDVFQDVEPYRSDNGVELTGRGEPVLLTSVLMRGTLPAFLGVKPALGRSFTRAETADSARVALISHALWETRFGGSRTVLGRTLELDNEPWTIIGVMPARVGTPDGAGPADVWQPLRDTPQSPPLVVARLRRGVTVEQAQKRLDEVAQRHVQDGAQAFDWEGRVLSVSSWSRGGLYDSLRILMVAVTLLLLVACVNVANLLLSRAQVRRQEMAVRTALGAGGGTLVRQALVESLLLGMAGGALGLTLAWGGLHALGTVRPPQLAALRGLGIDRRVAAFAALVSVGAGLLFGVAPAVHIAQSRTLTELTGGTRVAGGGRGARFRWGLVAGEVALSFALLVGSVMVLTSLLRTSSQDPGFDPDGLVALHVHLPSWSYGDSTARRHAFDAMERGMRGLVGVKAVALSSGGVPPGMSIVFGKPRVAGTVRDSAGVAFRGGAVGIHFLDVIGEPIVLGRGFTRADVGSSEHPVVLGRGAARLLFPDGSPLGRHFDLGHANDTYTVVGVARDALIAGLVLSRGKFSKFIMYTPMDHVYGDMDFVVRASGPIDARLLDGLRGAVRAVAPDAVVERVARIDALMAQSLARQRFTTFLLTAFGVLALLLSAVGLYGVVAQIAGQRTREIGIRMSLGAGGGDIRRMVLSAGVGATVAGLVGGLGLTLVGMSLLSSQVFGLESGDVAAYATAAVVMTLTALLASWMPARRASRVDPVEAIRTE